MKKQAMWATEWVARIVLILALCAATIFFAKVLVFGTLVSIGKLDTYNPDYEATYHFSTDRTTSRNNVCIHESHLCNFDGYSIDTIHKTCELRRLDFYWYGRKVEEK